jgi:serine/threonine protein kinase
MEVTIPAIPGYEILGELGRGGMGIVYKAQNVQDDHLVAVPFWCSPTKQVWNHGCDPWFGDQRLKSAHRRVHEDRPRE